MLGPRPFVFDQSGNFFIPDSGGSNTAGTLVTEYSAGGVTSYYSVATTGPYGAAVDGKGDVFIMCNGVTAGAVYELTASTIASGGGSTTGTAVAATSVLSSLPAANVAYTSIGV